MLDEYMRVGWPVKIAGRYWLVVLFLVEKWGFFEGASSRALTRIRRRHSSSSRHHYHYTENHQELILLRKECTIAAIITLLHCGG